VARPDFSAEQRAVLVAAVQEHMRAEYDLELGRFEAESLIAFMAGTVGAVLYNRGLADAHDLVARQIDGLADAVYQLQRPVG